MLLIAAVPPFRTSVLRRIGATLIAEDPLATADLGVMMSESHASGATLELADLVKTGAIRRVAVVAPPDGIEVAQEFARRGVPFEDNAAQAIAQLVRLGVPPTVIDRIPVTDAGGTTSEGAAIAAWCARRQVKTVLILSSPDHGRRVRRRVRRAFAGTATRPIVRLTRYGTFRADDWWTRRDALRAGLVELEKLLLDVVAHPL